MSKSRLKKRFFVPLGLLLVLLVLIFVAYDQALQNKYFPITFAGDANISFLTKGEAVRKIENQFNYKTKQNLQFSNSSGNFNIDLSTSSAQLSYEPIIGQFNFLHTGNLFERLKKEIVSLVLPNHISPVVKISLDKQIAAIETSVNKPPQNAEVIFDEITTPEGSPSGRVQIKEGVDGISLDKQELENKISLFLTEEKLDQKLPLKSVSPPITTKRVLRAKGVLDNLLKEPLKLSFEKNSWTIDAKQLLTMLDLTTNTDNLLNQEKTKSYFASLAKEIDQQVQEGLFEFDLPTKKVAAFKPSKEGRKLDMDRSYQLLTEALENNEPKAINLPVDIVKPKIDTADINSLGIKELLGRGISNFAGSIPNRIYNVSLTAQKINGVLIAPGEVFSFNKTVGDISAATGFKQAYVIKEGRTVLDDGGGVCQDSTTLFRAVLNAGLPVLKRTAHAYRVGYYEQGFPPGLDATVFYPSVDFQFKNDTPAHILIQSYTSGTTLYVDLYGTSDGRVASLTKPVVTDQTPPPPDLRQDDPTLPKGTIKQVDFSAWGAIVSFKRTVTRGQENLINETWKSFYKPWQAVYLVGTQ